MRKKFYISAGGCCPRRSLDLMKIEKYLKKNNAEILESSKGADHIIYLSCAFIEPFIIDAIDSIKVLEKEEGELIVGGCLELIDDRFKDVVKGRNFNTLGMDKLEKLFPEFEHKWNTITDAGEYHYTSSKCFSSGTMNEIAYNPRGFSNDVDAHVIRVADGCDSHCTYCSHKKAIGKYKSKSQPDIIGEFLRANPINKTYLITAMDIGCYGKDTNTSLPELLNTMRSIKKDAIFILDELNPKNLVEYQDDIIKLCKQGVIKKIQCNVQSGSNRMLKLMGRYQNTDILTKIFNEIQKTGVEIVTQIIIGFPTETYDDVNKTIKFVENLDYIFIYQYFENDNIVSSKIIPKVTDIISRVRYVAEYFTQRGIPNTHFEEPTKNEI